MWSMARTNVVVDERLLTRVIQLYGLRTKRKAIEFALRMTPAASDDPHGQARGLEGRGWAADGGTLRDEPVSTL